MINIITEKETETGLVSYEKVPVKLVTNQNLVPYLNEVSESVARKINRVLSLQDVSLDKIEDSYLHFVMQKTIETRTTCSGITYVGNEVITKYRYPILRALEYMNEEREVSGDLKGIIETIYNGQASSYKLISRGKRNITECVPGSAALSKKLKIDIGLIEGLGIEMHQSDVSNIIGITKKHSPRSKALRELVSNTLILIGLIGKTQYQDELGETQRINLTRTLLKRDSV